MHFVLCRFLRILEDMSSLSFLRIFILLEEPPHLTADNASIRFEKSKLSKRNVNFESNYVTLLIDKGYGGGGSGGVLIVPRLALRLF